MNLVQCAQGMRNVFVYLNGEKMKKQTTLMLISLKELHI